MYLYLVEIATIVPNISVKHRLVKTASLNDETKHSTNEERSKEQTNKIILDTTYFSRDSYFTNFANRYIGISNESIFNPFISSSIQSCK